MIPEDGVGVEFEGGIEPQIDSLFPVTFAVGEYIGLNGVGLSRPVAQELEI